MWLSMLFVWGCLLALVASQSCPDPSENSASWMRLKPLGQCKDGESTCPYRITLPPLTVQLPKPFRELEKMARELQSLRQLVNQLKEDCRECKERQGMEWNIRTDDEGEDGERIQASRGTLNTRKRQQDLAKRESTVQVTTSRSAMEDTMIIRGDGKQRNTNQERNVNPRTTKPRTETNGGPKGSNPSQKNPISRSMSNVGEVPSLTTIKKKILQPPMAKVPESSFAGDLDSEQPAQLEKQQASTIKVGHEMYPSETLTAKGKVKTIPEYPVVIIVTEDDDHDDDIETEKLQTPKGDKVLGERQLVTTTDAQNNRELEPNMKQHTREQQDKEDKKEVADTGLKESRSNIFDDTTNSNVAKEGSANVIQHSTMKNNEKEEQNNHNIKPKATKPNTLKYGTYSERDAEVNSRPINTDDTIRGRKKLTAPITGRATASVNVSQINPQPLEIKSKNAFKSDIDAKMDIGPETKLDTTETVSGQATSRTPISGITNGIVDVSPTNPQTLYSRKQLNAGTNSESNTGIKSNSVKNVDTVSGQKNSTPHTSGRANATADVDLIYQNIQTGNIQTPFKPGADAESNTEMDSNPINGLNNSRLHISGITNGMADVSPTNPHVLDNSNQFKVGRDTESDAGIDSNLVNNSEIVGGLKNSRSPISDGANATADLHLISPKRLSSNSQSSLKSSKNSEHNTGMDLNPVNKIEKGSGQDMSRSPISGVTDGKVDVNSTNPQIVHSKNQVKSGTDSGSDARVGSNQVNNFKTVMGKETSRSPISGITDSTVDVSPRNLQTLDRKNQFRTGTDSESDAVRDPDPVNNVATVSGFSELQTAKSPISGKINAVDVNQTHPGTPDNTFKNTFQPGTDKDRKPEKHSNPLNNLEINSPLETPQLSIPDSGDVIVNVNQMNTQTVYSNSEYATVVSTPVNNVETVSRLETPRPPISSRSHGTADQINPQLMNHTSKNTLKHGTNSERKAGMSPNQDHTTDIVSQQESSESPISDLTLDVSGTTPIQNRSDDLPNRWFLPKSKLNMTQPRNGWIKISNPMSTDSERKKPLRNNKTTSLRSELMTRDRHRPTRLLPMRIEKQQEITNQPERTSPNGTGLRKNPRPRKPYILQKIPVNESKAFGLGEPKNTSGVIDYTMHNGTTHVNFTTVSSPNNELNSTAYGMSQSVKSTLATQHIVDQAHIKIAKTSSTVEVLHTIVNDQTENTSQTTITRPRLEKSGGNSRQDLVLDTVNNIRRDSQPPRVVTSESKELNYPTTVATPFMIKKEFKDKQIKMPQFTPPIITTPHFMDQDHAEQVKTTSGVKVSNKHVYHTLESPSQEMESKRSHSNTGNKELQNANNGQGSSLVTNVQTNSLDSIQNRAAGSMPIVMDIVKAITDSKMSTTSIERTGENSSTDSNTVAMDNIEASTEANQVTPSSDTAPVKYHRFSKTPLGSADSVEGNDEGHSIDDNNGNSYPAAVNRMTGATLHKIPAGHTSNGHNKKPLTVNDMDDRQGLEKQLLSNCHGPCDLRPTPQSILNSRESSNNDRDKTFQDCSDFIMRKPTSGIYNVSPTASRNRTFPIFCDMKSSGGGWTVIQHRFDGSISFNRTWNDYKNGFGNLTGEFWLGNDKIHWLTVTKPMVLRIELEDLDGMKEFAQYNHFSVANESQYYRLTIEGYSGTAGDAMQYSKKFNHNQKNFTTPDRDNDQYTSGNCGSYYSSGWWFDACMAANLNGKYYETRYRGVRNGIFWGTWHNITTESYLTHERQSFKTVRMMIRPRTGPLMD